MTAKSTPEKFNSSPSNTVENSRVGNTASNPPRQLVRKLTTTKEINCFVCTVNTKDSPELAMDTTNYPMTLYSKIFNHFAKILCVRNSNKKIVQLSEERVKTVALCIPCHGQILQLYRLCNSPKSNSHGTQEHIKLVTNLLKFKMAFAKRNNSKIRHIIKAPSDPTKYHVNGYWHLRITEEKCSSKMSNLSEVSEILTELDISKLTADYGIYDESHLYLSSPDWEVTPSSGQDDGDRILDDSGKDGMEVDDDDDDIGMMVDSGRIAPIDLVEVDMGNDFLNPNSGNGSSLLMEAPFFNVPVGEIKQPRKQILASRVGVSSKAPIIKTIIRDREKRTSDEDD